MSTSLLFHCFGIRQVRVHRTDYIAGQAIFHAEVKERLLRCPCCGSCQVIRYGSKVRHIRLVPIGRKAAILRLKTYRIRCRSCDAIRWIKLPFVTGKSNCSHALIRYLLDLCCLMTIKAVANLLGVGWDLVKDHHKEFLARKYRRRRWQKLRYIGIDEFAVKKGHHYLTIAVNLETGEIIYVSQGKSQHSIIPLLIKLRRYSGGLRAVAVDMNPGYIEALIRYLPKVPMVFDHFHVVRMAQQTLEDMRRQQYPELLGIKGNILKGSRYLLLRHYADLPPEDKHRLKELLRINEPLTIAYLMKEQLSMLWDLPSRAEAERFLNAWGKDAFASGISALVKLGRSILSHRVGILNYFDHPISCGMVEGINNKIKTLKRQVYGFRDMAYFTLRLYHLHQQNYSLSG
jgi:transposase